MMLSNLRDIDIVFAPLSAKGRGFVSRLRHNFGISARPRLVEIDVGTYCDSQREEDESTVLKSCPG